jgi:hypothetical protein
MAANPMLDDEAVEECGGGNEEEHPAADVGWTVHAVEEVEEEDGSPTRRRQSSYHFDVVFVCSGNFTAL